MAKSLDIASWRKTTPKEMASFYKSRERGKGKKKKPISSGFLVVRTRLRPADIYAYLRARFGIPNGFQNLFRRDDSDNWIHWDFNLKADDIDVYIAGNRLDAARANGVYRAALSCGNLAHGFAACSPSDKAKLAGSKSLNLGIVTSYNDMLSAHQPYQFAVRASSKKDSVG